MTARVESVDWSSYVLTVARSAAAFYAVFALHTATAGFLLLLGLASSLASISPAALESFQDGAQSGSSFGPLWTLIVQTVIFSGSAFILQRTLRQVIGGPNEFAVADAALSNGLLFPPLRRRIQQVLARRIKPRTVDANYALAEFRATLRSREIDLSELRERVLRGARCAACAQSGTVASRS